MSDALERLKSMLEVGGITSKDEFYAAIDAAFDDAPPVQNTIHPLYEPDLDVSASAVLVYPLPTGKWAVFIPPTQPEHFTPSFDEDGTEKEFEPDGDNIIEPWGESEFDTLMGAVAWLSIATKQGKVVFNDGRVAQ